MLYENMGKLILATNVSKSFNFYIVTIDKSNGLPPALPSQATRGRFFALPPLPSHRPHPVVDAAAGRAAAAARGSPETGPARLDPSLSFLLPLPTCKHCRLFWSPAVVTRGQIRVSLRRIQSPRAGSVRRCPYFVGRRSGCATVLVLRSPPPPQASVHGCRPPVRRRLLGLPSSWRAPVTGIAAGAP